MAQKTRKSIDKVDQKNLKFINICQNNSKKAKNHFSFGHWVREAAKKGSFLSGRATKRGGGAKRVWH